MTYYGIGFSFPPPKPPPKISVGVGAKFGYILSPPWDGYTLDDEAEDRDLAFPVVRLSDTGTRRGGETVRYNRQWQTYHQLVNPNPIISTWIFDKGKLLNNIGFDANGSALCEFLTVGESFFQYDLETDQAVRMVAFPENYDTNLLDPRKFNGIESPWLFWQALSHNERGKMFLVGMGWYAYIARVKRTEMWIERRTKEGKPNFVAFPPREDGYYLRGPNVSGGNGENLLSYPGGVRTFHNPQKFSLPGSIGPVPPAGWR